MPSWDKAFPLNGYKKHDGGLIEQWGTSVVATTSSAYGTVYFPKPFPNRTFMVVAGSAMGNSGIANKAMSVFDTAAPDAFNFYADAPSTTLRINWMWQEDIRNALLRFFER